LLLVWKKSSTGLVLALGHEWSSIRQGLYLKRGDREGSAFPVSLTGLGRYWGSLGGVKTNAVGLDVMGSLKREILPYTRQ